MLFCCICTKEAVSHKNSMCIDIYYTDFLFAAILFFCYRKGHTRIDFILVSLISILLIFTLSAHGPLNQVLQIPVFSFLGKLSVPLFTSHWSVRRIVPYLFPKATYTEMLPVYLLGSIMLATLLYIVHVWIQKQKIMDRLRKLFIQQQ